MKSLSRSQKAVYDFIVKYSKEMSYPPTVREICTALDLKSTSTVHSHILSLERKGLLKRCPSKQRSISIIEQNGSELIRNCTNVPLVGNIAAGKPILAEENIQDFITLPNTMLKGTGSELFMLNVEGDSMIDAGIFDGDMIIVQKDASIEYGDIVVARIGGESATVKRFYPEKDKIRLQPENPSMQPIYADFNDVEIDGKVIGLLRKF
ncbi:MAG: LexA repressor [Firmicutes bacterium ADurb.Bin182]|nr:MAG: LexA repressor [Firmicutes bacterium ADurb.Bin182]